MEGNWREEEEWEDLDLDGRQMLGRICGRRRLKDGHRRQ